MSRQGCFKIGIELFRSGLRKRIDLDNLVGLDYEKEWFNRIKSRLNSTTYDLPGNFKNKTKNIRLRDLTADCISANIHNEFVLNLLAWMCHKKEALDKYREERRTVLQVYVRDVMPRECAAVVARYTDWE
jgi:hypothetical protein